MAVELPRCGGLLGADRERSLALLRRGIADVDRGVGQEPQKLEPELPEPARAEHERT